MGQSEMGWRGIQVVPTGMWGLTFGWGSTKWVCKSDMAVWCEGSHLQPLFMCLSLRVSSVSAVPADPQSRQSSGRKQRREMQTPAPVSRHLFRLPLVQSCHLSAQLFSPVSSFLQVYSGLLWCHFSVKGVLSSSNITSIRGHPSASCTNPDFTLSTSAHCVICERQHV
jgi:hypothetical protein